ncbi:MAG: hypothetical protein ACK559_03105, partial [bacterium]
ARGLQLLLPPRAVLAHAVGERGGRRAHLAEAGGHVLAHRLQARGQARAGLGRRPRLHELADPPAERQPEVGLEGVRVTGAELGARGHRRVVAAVGVPPRLVLARVPDLDLRVAAHRPRPAADLGGGVEGHGARDPDVHVVSVDVPVLHG